MTSVETELNYFKDTYQGKEVLEKYLGDTISQDGKQITIIV